MRMFNPSAALIQFLFVVSIILTAVAISNNSWLIDSNTQSLSSEYHFGLLSWYSTHVRDGQIVVNPTYSYGDYNSYAAYGLTTLGELERWRYAGLGLLICATLQMLILSIILINSYFPNLALIRRLNLRFFIVPLFIWICGLLTICGSFLFEFVHPQMTGDFTLRYPFYLFIISGVVNFTTAVIQFSMNVQRVYHRQNPARSRRISVDEADTTVKTQKTID